MCSPEKPKESAATAASAPAPASAASRSGASITSTSSSSSSDSADSCSNQLMTLVDAATKIFDDASKSGEVDKLKAPAASAKVIAMPAVSPSPTTIASSASSGSLSTTTTTTTSRTAAPAAAATPSSSIYNASSSSSIFLDRLRTTLDNDSITVLQWMPRDNRDAFHIVNPKTFSKNELQSIFRFKNMSSFLRKLNQLGFSRIHDKVTMNLDIFCHKEFVRVRRTGDNVVKSNASATSPAASPPASPPRLSAKRPLPKNAVVDMSKAPRLSAVSSSPSKPSSMASMAMKERLSRAQAASSPSHPRFVQEAALSVARQPTILEQQHSAYHQMQMPPHRVVSLPGMASISIAATATTAAASTMEHQLDSPLVQSLLRERESLLKGMNHMSVTLSSLLLKQQKQAQHHHP